MIDCDCPDIIERLRWLISGNVSVVFNEDQLRAYNRRIRELEGMKELKDI